MPQVKIARVKGDGPLKKTHFAVKVSGKGHVDVWADSEAQAVPVEMAVAEKVAAFYADRENAGTLLFGDAETGRPCTPAVNGTVPRPTVGPKGGTGTPPKADPKALADAEADCGDREEQVAAVGESLAAANKENDRLCAELRQTKAERDEFVQRARSALKGEVETLKAQLAEANAIIASAK